MNREASADRLLANLDLDATLSSSSQIRLTCHIEASNLRDTISNVTIKLLLLTAHASCRMATGSVVGCETSLCKK